jgi:hypothetical protein
MLAYDDPHFVRANAEFNDKYAQFRTARGSMAEDTKTHYERPRAFFEFTPDERILSWDNRRLGLDEPETTTS